MRISKQRATHRIPKYRDSFDRSWSTQLLLNNERGRTIVVQSAFTLGGEPVLFNGQPISIRGLS